VKGKKKGQIKPYPSKNCLEGRHVIVNAPPMDDAFSIFLPPFASSNPNLRTHRPKTLEIIVEQAHAAHVPLPPWRIGNLGYTIGLGVGRSMR